MTDPHPRPTPFRRWLAWLIGLFSPRQTVPAGALVQVIVYTRCGCHLCEVAWEQLARARDVYGFEMSAVDVDGDPALQREHGLHVPVVVIDGKVRFRGRINSVLLTRLLEAERGRGRGFRCN
jgi:glutaredoxin